jgi:hypothetical protein
VILGEDSIDFDLTLKELNFDPGRHPAGAARSSVAAESEAARPWMQTPVADTPNNWIDVKGKNNDGKYVAAVGKETFDVEIKTSLKDGKILSATTDNLVQTINANAPTPRCWTAASPPPTRFAARSKSSWRPDKEALTMNSPKIPALGYALLGLLMKPSSGYDLRKIFSSTSMKTYSGSPGAIYPALRRPAKTRSDPRHGRGRFRPAPPPDVPPHSEGTRRTQRMDHPAHHPRRPRIGPEDSYAALRLQRNRRRTRGLARNTQISRNRTSNPTCSTCANSCRR